MAFFLNNGLLLADCNRTLRLADIQVMGTQRARWDDVRHFDFVVGFCAWQRRPRHPLARGESVAE